VEGTGKIRGSLNVKTSIGSADRDRSPRSEAVGEWRMTILWRVSAQYFPGKLR
jgi:hypothetical protein